MLSIQKIEQVIKQCISMYIEVQQNYKNNVRLFKTNDLKTGLFPLLRDNQPAEKGKAVNVTQVFKGFDNI